ncbi:MAG: hydrogenase maturation protease [Phycisphaerales bacterium]|nr:MAG: hydrogenase maturation protease [Phycisphaerales bacterium]
MGTSSGKPQKSPPPIRIIGCGRALRRDDQVGLVIAKALREHAARLNEKGTRISVETTEAPGAELFISEDPDRHSLLIIIDAAHATQDVAPGTCTRIDYHAQPQRVGAKCRTNTHTLGVDAALETAAVLGLLPKTVWVYAVAGEKFGYSDELSPAVRASVNDLPGRIERDVQSWLSQYEKK